MASDLWNIVLNVVASFIYAGMIWLWQRRRAKPSLTSPAAVPQAAPYEPSLDSRAQNRRTLEHAGHQFFFYLLTFALLYLSITMPPLFKALFSKAALLLSDARFIGSYLPDVPVGRQYLQISFFLFAAVLYWPLLLIAEFFTSLIYPVVDKVWRVTPRIWRAIKLLFCTVLCVPVAGTSIWLFYEKSFTDALVMVLFVCGLVFVMGQAQSERRHV